MNTKRKEILQHLIDISNEVTLVECQNKQVIKVLVHKVKSENVLIHDIVDIPIDCNNSSLYYSIACPNYECNFVFDHPLDHYPFMLLIELARQISIGTTHKYKNIPTKSIKNTVPGLALQIHRFAELDQPLIIGCHDTIIKDKPAMQIRELEFFYVQKGELCAEMKSSISIMSDDLYYRYRTNNRKQIIPDSALCLVTNLDMLATI